ncbi:hypothetical protein B0A49_08783 [Cryomyces minteri]|uniref:Uncharacterized protein n=1 Tax=Cryomyces minteri TaxID=331657 RepID=A0A4U0WKE9_9PEZI|nr:hypothetical protein B0A49_08783 [Cryomyces minteri]
MLISFFLILPKAPLKASGPNRKDYETLPADDNSASLSREDEEDVDGLAGDDYGLLSASMRSRSTGTFTSSNHKTAGNVGAWCGLKANLARSRSLFFPYMLPLLLVYIAEYTINQGVAPTLLFPVGSSPFTHYRAFYPTYNAIYQVGVFISRSSTPFFRVHNLYVPSFLQIVNLIVLTLHALFDFIPNVYYIFAVVFWEGLLGGLVYVNTFAEITDKVKQEDREFSLGATSSTASTTDRTTSGSRRSSDAFDVPNTPRSKKRKISRVTPSTRQSSQSEDPYGSIGRLTRNTRLSIRAEAPPELKDYLELPPEAVPRLKCKLVDVTDCKSIDFPVEVPDSVEPGVFRRISNPEDLQCMVDAARAEREKRRQRLSTNLKWRQPGGTPSTRASPIPQDTLELQTTTPSSLRPSSSSPSPPPSSVSEHFIGTPPLARRNNRGTETMTSSSRPSLRVRTPKRKYISPQDVSNALFPSSEGESDEELPTPKHVSHSSTSDIFVTPRSRLSYVVPSSTARDTPNVRVLTSDRAPHQSIDAMSVVRDTTMTSSALSSHSPPGFLNEILGRCESTFTSNLQFFIDHEFRHQPPLLPHQQTQLNQIKSTAADELAALMNKLRTGLKHVRDDDEDDEDVPELVPSPKESPEPEFEPECEAQTTSLGGLDGTDDVHETEALRVALRRDLEPNTDLNRVSDDEQDEEEGVSKLSPPPGHLPELEAECEARTMHLGSLNDTDEASDTDEAFETEACGADRRGSLRIGFLLNPAEAEAAPGTAHSGMEEEEGRLLRVESPSVERWKSTHG